MHSVHGQHHTDINIGLMTELKCCQMHACDNAHIPVLEFIRLLQVLIRLDHRCFDVESDSLSLMSRTIFFLASVTNVQSGQQDRMLIRCHS